MTRPTGCTPEKLQTIREMAPSHPTREIAKRLGVGSETIARWARSATPPIKLFSRSEACKHKYAQPGARERLSLAMIKAGRSDLKPKRRKPLRERSCLHPPEVRREVVALRGKLSAEQIAAKLGLASKNVVIGLWDRVYEDGRAPR